MKQMDFAGREITRLNQELEEQKAAVRELTEALRLTVEYVGTSMLPPVEGWSWFDALSKHAPEVAKGFVDQYKGPVPSERIEASPWVMIPLLNEWYRVLRSHTSARVMAKLPEEAQEFMEATNPLERLQEGADVIIVVLTQLVADGWTYAGIMREVTRKLRVNIDREWAVNEDGTISHVKGGELTQADAS